MKKSLTLVVPVYNAARYLELVLTALQRQSMTDFEVIVADDGSGLEIRELIDQTKNRVPFPIQHLWHEDIGFQKNAILNKAINASQTDYLVFIDGDCIPHHKFLFDHWSHHRENTLLCGRRVNLSKRMSEQLTVDDIASGHYEKLTWKLILDGMLRRSSYLENAIRIENKKLRRLFNRNRASIVGSNFSIHKHLLEQINGFNEDYTMYGLGEDSEIAFRLQLLGVKLVSLRYLALLFHLYHPQKEVSEENKRIYEQVVQARNPICPNGLRKLHQYSPTMN